MDQFPENIKMILQYDSVPAKEIQEIYGVNKKNEAVVKMEIPVAEKIDVTEDIPELVKTQEAKEEAPVQKETVKKQNTNTGYRNRKNNKK